MPEAHLNVLLLRHTPNPEETIALAAKLCYSPSDIEALKGKIEARDQKAFVERLMKMGHLSPIEHASFTFAVEGISRACSHQLVRHRLASYSQQSQRYVSEESGFDYIIPPTIKADDALTARYKKLMEQAQEAYRDLVAGLNMMGITGEAANQDARFALPNAAETKIIITMNARELLHFFRQRCCMRAQWEIRAMADEMLNLAKQAAPIVFAKAGPGCCAGPCPEGEYSCGKPADVRKRYGVSVRDEAEK
ncbi:MAG TPA: FAD-dependent thymidylate synthase [Dissulfurispiraceae bacterium]|nr:FAD-dependent thymidylate synthase [Dissulfurispiraceae bacterium]